MPENLSPKKKMTAVALGIDFINEQFQILFSDKYRD